MKQKTRILRPDQFVLDVSEDQAPTRYPSNPQRSMRAALGSGDQLDDVRLSKYKEEYCDKLLRMASSGYSARAFCASIDISYATFLRWKDCIPDFAEAVEVATMKRHLFYEHQGLTNLDNREFNCGLFDRLTKAVAKWKDDQVTVEHQHTHVLKRPEEMTAQERRDKIKELTSRLNAVN